MFGFNKKNVPPELIRKLIDVANEAYGGLAGLLENGKLAFRKFSLDLNDVGTREKIVSNLRELLASLSHNPDNWPEDLRRVVEENRGSENPYRIAAVTIFAALLKTNTCCKVALDYPYDDRFKSITLKVVVDNMAALDQIALAQQPASIFESSPSIEICSELMHVKRFLDNHIKL